MNLLILLLFIASPYTTLLVAGADDSDEARERWMELPLDHFNLFDNRTWKMRYFVNPEFFQEGKPLFLYVGGEAPINYDDITAGQLHKLAKKHHGMLVYPEHRYYGKSLPFGEEFENIEDLKYLQIEQALEDLAYFIEHFKALTPGVQNSIVVVHGCSYPGMLTTWARLRYPHLVDIGYASSAPLGVGLDYPEFYEIVHDAYANVSPECIQTIKRGFNQTQELVKTKIGLKVVRDALRDWDCGDPDKMNSVKILSKMREVLITMYDRVGYQELGCLVMSEDDVSPFHKLANFIVEKTTKVMDCADTTPTPEEMRSNVAWAYQTCTEMGTFQTLDRKNARNPFEMDSSLQESVDNCVENFGGIVTEDVLNNGIERVTRRYGGKRPKVTKVISVQGTNDPWKHLASLEDYNEDAPVIVIPGSHCVDISEAPNDPKELWDIREQIRNVVSTWIEELS